MPARNDRRDSGTSFHLSDDLFEIALVAPSGILVGFPIDAEQAFAYPVGAIVDEVIGFGDGVAA